MALNPQLLPPYAPNAPPFPAPYAGEHICASRESCHFKIDGLPGALKFAGKGVVFLTNYRLVFVAEKPKPDLYAVEIPLLFVKQENVSQPIFGANNLSGLCKPVDAPPDATQQLKWKVSFINGGLGTLVPLFYSALTYLRRATENAAARAQEQAAPLADGVAAAVATQPPPFMQTALVDPSDPTKIYLTSQVPTEQAAAPPKFPIV